MNEVSNIHFVGFFAYRHYLSKKTKSYLETQCIIDVKLFWIFFLKYMKVDLFLWFFFSEYWQKEEFKMLFLALVYF